MGGQAESAGELRLAGPFTIRNIAELHKALQAALASGNDLSIDLPGDAAADISFVQLLASARVSARAAGHDIRLKNGASGPLLDVLERGGFLATDDTAFWSAGASLQ